MQLVWFRAACFACLGLLLTLVVAVRSEAQEPVQTLSGSAIGGAAGRQLRPLPERRERVNPLIDGDRQGFASAWTNNFCLRWTDGCSTCSRDEVWDPIRCERHEDQACAPVRVRCEVPDYAALNLSCERYGADCNLYSAWVENPDGGTGVGTRKACPSLQRDYRCHEDWASYERRFCGSETPDGQQRCQEVIAQATAGRATRPKIAFPGLRR